MSAAGLLSLVPTTAVLGSASAAESPTTLSTYNGQASANASYVLFALPKFLIIENLVNGGGPTAQAALDSLGGSTGFASFPYPGDLAVAFPGLAGTLSGKPVPSYPFVVTSQYPSAQESSLDQPGYHLDAIAHEDEAVSNAQAGARLAPSSDEGGTFATASVKRTADGFVSLAESRLNTQIGTVAINGAISRAQVAVDNAGHSVESSDFRLSSLSVNGVGITMSQDGFQLVGSPLPAQKSMTVGPTTIRFVEAQTTADSVLAPGLQITTPLEIPAPVGRTVVVELIVGRSFAQASGVASPDPGGALGSNDAGSGLGPIAGGTVSPDGSGVDGIGTLPATTDLGVDTLPIAPASAAPGAAQTFQMAYGAPTSPSLPSLGAYPYLAAGALLFLLATVGPRLVVGVRRSWN